MDKLKRDEPKKPQIGESVLTPEQAAAIKDGKLVTKEHFLWGWIDPRVIHGSEGNDMTDTERLLADKLEAIRRWCDAYPLKVFPEPDLEKAAKLLSAGGMTLDAISASSMRYVLNGIKKIIDE
jgi:hypothetical protein